MDVCPCILAAVWYERDEDSGLFRGLVSFRVWRPRLGLGE